MLRTRTAIVAATAAAVLVPLAVAAPRQHLASPSIRVLALATGQVVTGNSISTKIAVHGWVIDGMLAGKANRSGVGPYHIHLDGVLVNAYGSPRASISLQNVKPGKHTLTFVLAEDNHMELAKTAKNVSFVYRSAKPLPTIKPAKLGKPSIRIVSPKNGTVVSGSFPLKVAVKNFHLSAALFGKPDLAGWGHWHVFLDKPSLSTMLAMTAKRTAMISLQGVKPGKHTIIAMLADDFHAPVPGTMSKVTIRVR